MKKAVPKEIAVFPSEQLSIPAIFCVTSPDSDILLKLQVRDAQQLLKQIPGALALAANQMNGLNAPRRFFVVDEAFAKDNNIPSVMINPSWSPHYSLKDKAKEGCLSFPGIYPTIERYDVIATMSWDENWKAHNMLMSGMAARMFQHECEHLDGETFLKNVDRIEKFQIIARLKKTR